MKVIPVYASMNDDRVVAYAIVDDQAYSRCKKKKWVIWYRSGVEHGKVYAQTTVRGRPIQMHNFIFGKAEEGLVWDHINGHPLDYRSKNMRQVTISINNRNLHPNNNARRISDIRKLIE